MQHYEVKAGETLAIHGPANIIVKTGDVPVVGEATPPVITALEPDTAVCGDATDIEMFVNGTGFTAASVIVFGGQDEPITFYDATRVSTIVKPSLFVAPDAVPVEVRNGPQSSNSVPFTFTDGSMRSRRR